MTGPGWWAGGWRGGDPPYVALEGAEGCGKSTQAALLAAALGAVLTQETGGTAIGQRLRAVLHDTDVDDLDDRAEALIVAADRAQHFAQVVRPTLAAGRPVVSDRSVYSTLAYQGYGRGLDLAELRRLNDWAIDGLWPDLIVFVQAPPDVTAARLEARELDRFEQAGDDFHARVLAGFRAMAEADPRALGRDRSPAAPRTRSPPQRARRDDRSTSRSSTDDQRLGWRRSANRLPIAALDRAAVAPVHAYLFVGPPGSTKDQAAQAFAALLLTGRDDPASRDARLALAGEHPDVREVMRVGPAISTDQAGEIVRQASLAPIEGDRKVHDPPRLPPAQRHGGRASCSRPSRSRRRRPTSWCSPTSCPSTSSRSRRAACASSSPRSRSPRSPPQLVAEGRRPGGRRRGGRRRGRRRRPGPAAGRRPRLRRPPRPVRRPPPSARRHRLGRRRRGSRGTRPDRDRRRAAGRTARNGGGRPRRDASSASGPGAADGRPSRPATSARRGATGPTSCATDWRCSPGAIATLLVGGDATHPDSLVAAVHRIHDSIEALDHNPNETLLLQSLLWALPPLP